MNRETLLKQFGQIILSIKSLHPLRVGIDGVDASGKTMSANAIADYLELRKIQIIRATIDGFHNPKMIRYQKG